MENSEPRVLEEAVDSTPNADGKTVISLRNGVEPINSKFVTLALGRRLMARDLGRSRITDPNAAWETV